MNVRLQNKGLRHIGVAEGKAIAPDAVAIVSEDIAKRLLRLYPGELVDIDNLKASFSVITDLTKEAPAKAAEEPVVEPVIEPVVIPPVEKTQEEIDAEIEKQLEEEEKLARIAAGESEGLK